MTTPFAVPAPDTDPTLTIEDSTSPLRDRFADLAMDSRVLTELTALGYEEPTPIQRLSIPALLAGRDVLAQAATGTGKTAAFALPLLHALTPHAEPRSRTTALVLVPTRELAMQVAEAVNRYGRGLGAVAVPIYGGAPMDAQIRALKRGTDVVVATPGRVLDHVRRRTVHLASVRTVVLDEADEMLDMGFEEDLEAILAATPAGKQVALFSATLAPRIEAIAHRHLRDPEVIRIDREAIRPGRPARVRQVAYLVSREHKAAALGRILDVERPSSAIVFCRTRTEVDELAEALSARGHRAEALHGGLSQDQRDRVMKRFRSKASSLLVATDVAARGLDVSHLSHVVNYDVPSSTDAYIHRIGRTGRAGRTGAALTLVEPRERRMLEAIERATAQTIDFATLPTVQELQARRLERLRASLRETIVEGGLEPWRSAVAALAEEFDPMDIAAAALKRADPGAVAGSDEEIPSPTPWRERRPGGGREATRTDRHGRRGAPKKPAGETRIPTPTEEARQPGRKARPEPTGRMDAEGAKGGKGTKGAKVRSETSAGRTPKAGTARLYIGGGRKLRIRANDLVGAIVDETGTEPSSIHNIQIFDRHALVEVPQRLADDIVAALSATTIKGRRLQVRRDRPVGR